MRTRADLTGLAEACEDPHCPLAAGRDRGILIITSQESHRNGFLVGYRHVPRPARHVLVAGNGMVGQRFVDRLVAADGDRCSIRLTVVGEESRPAYDRVSLSSWFDGTSEADLRLVDDEFVASRRVDYRFGRRVDLIDTDRRRATLDDGTVIPYDDLVLATGSYPFVPPIPGHRCGGAFVYRTLDDLEAIEAWASAKDRTTALVIGGGLLGLEAAHALCALGLEVHVVEMAPYPMPQQLGEGGGRMLGRWVDALGVNLHCGVAPDPSPPTTSATSPRS